MHTHPLQNDDCFAVRQAARQISQFYERHLSAAGLTTSQFSVLSVLAENPGITMVCLSTVLVVDRTTLLRTLKPLLKAGFVAAQYEAACARRLIFDLTAAGRDKLAHAAAQWRAAKKEFEQRFGQERACRLREELFRITNDIAKA